MATGSELNSNQLLRLGVRLNHVDIIKKALELGADVNYQNPNDINNTALHVAVSLGHREACYLLMSSGDISLINKTLVVNDNGHDPLHLAAICGRDEILPLFHKHWLIPKHYEGKMYPHHYAAMYGNAAALKFLLNNVTNNNHIRSLATVNGQTHNALTLAVAYSNVNMRRTLPIASIPEAVTGDYYETVETYLKIDTLGSGKCRCDAMAVAAQYNLVKMAKFLYEKGGYLKSLDHVSRFCHMYLREDEVLLHVAAKSGSLEMVQWLLNNGADKTIKNKSGQTPHDVAITGDIRKLLYILTLEENSSKTVTVETNEKEVIYGLLREILNDPTVHELVATCITLINIKIVGEQHEEKGPLLFLAAQKGLPIVMKALLDSGVYVNCRNNEKQTVLVWLMRNKDVPNCQEMVQILLDKGAGINLYDNVNRTAHSLANGYNDPISKMILAHQKEHIEGIGINNTCSCCNEEL